MDLTALIRAEVREYVTPMFEEVLTRIDATNVKIDACRTELKDEIQQVRTELKNDIQDVRDEIQDVRTELKDEIQDVRTELKGMRSEVDSLHVKLDKVLVFLGLSQN